MVAVEMKQETPTVSRSSKKLRHRPSRYGLSCRDSKWQWQETPIKSQGGIFFFLGGKRKRPPGTCVPSGVLQKAKIGERAKWTGRCKDAAEEKLTTPTTPNPTPPITTHRLQAINSLVIRRPIFNKAIAY